MTKERPEANVEDAVWVPFCKTPIIMHLLAVQVLVAHVLHGRFVPAVALLRPKAIPTDTC